MNTDVSRNMVAFRLRRGEGDGKVVMAHAPTRNNFCVQQAWAVVKERDGATPDEVVELFSEWEPSEADRRFIDTTFPGVRLTYRFPRPDDGGWEAAYASARQYMAKVARRKEAERANEVREGMRHTEENGVLLPILWSQRTPKKAMLDLVPTRPLVPGHLSVGLARVAPTPRGTIGMNHVAHGGLNGGSLDELLEPTFAAVTEGLRIDGHTDEAHPERGMMLVVKREGMFGSSALALPGFADRVCGILGADRLVVGVPDADTVLVTAEESGWAPDVRRKVLESPCPSGELVPILLTMTRDEMRFVAERPDVTPR